MHRDRRHDDGKSASRGCATQPPAPDHAAQADERLHATLAVALPALRDCCRDPWVVIGSAAALLIGADVNVADLDVLTSLRDADALSEHWQDRREIGYRPADDGRFRSRFARYRFPGRPVEVMPVEVMGGLEIFGADGWHALRIDRIVHVNVAGLSVPVPCLAEQIRVLQTFGRPKDQARIAALQTLREPRA